MISYVSCHDDMCLVDRLKSSIPGITPEELARLDKLAQTAVFTSQGVPFIYAGEEVMRDKERRTQQLSKSGLRQCHRLETQDGACRCVCLL